MRDAREPIPDIAQGCRLASAKATPHLETTFSKLNASANMAAFNPNGAEPTGTAGRDEGYLFWAGVARPQHRQPLLGSGDGNGYYRRIYLSMGCEQINDLISDPNPAVQQLTQLVTGFTNAVIAPACALSHAKASSIIRPHPDRSRRSRSRASSCSCSCGSRSAGRCRFKAKSYQITAYFPEATQLAVESDVRIGGVSVGKVKEIGLAPAAERVINGNDTTEAVIEIEPQYAPISEDAQAILRQKTLLGETYVELTSGTEPDFRRAARFRSAPRASV